MDTIRAFLNKHEPWLIGLAVVAVLYMYQERPFQPVAAAEGTAAAGASGPTTEYSHQQAAEAFNLDNNQPNATWNYGVDMPPKSFSNCIGRNWDYAKSQQQWDFKDKSVKKCCAQAGGTFNAGEFGAECALVGRPDTSQ